MWTFLSRGYGETEGYSNGSLAEFKGNPLQALAREICQNSLDAADDSGRPVRIEFEAIEMMIDDFPGMEELRDVFNACDEFWSGKGDANTKLFLKNARDCFMRQSGKFRVLRISDYNTTGVMGAFSDDDITPWGSLVKGNSFSVKTDTKNAAGSYGIGKAAPFVSSFFQTVFYRTLDEESVTAALGVARLMAHEAVQDVPAGEDTVRRSVGYYGLDDFGKPQRRIEGLDKLNKRTTCGTDLFIPGFTQIVSNEKWVKDILKEIAENFLYSIYSGKLEVVVGNRVLSKATLSYMLGFVESKEALNFYEVIRENPKAIELQNDFHGLGQLRLRLLYEDGLNKKVLVVRNSGMRISRISSLPRTISYVGFLELQGDDLNHFFRNMENPSHNAWEPKRHADPERAKKYKEEVESWVIEKITEKLIEISGEEQDVNVGDCFNMSEDDNTESRTRREAVINDVDKYETEAYIPQKPASGKISIRDEGANSSNKRTPGRADPNGDLFGHRRRTGKKTGLSPSGRKVGEDPVGPDYVNAGEGSKDKEVPIRARIIKQGKTNKLIFIADEKITLGRIEIITKGENGKSLRLKVSSVSGECAEVSSGHIVIKDIPENIKQCVEFELSDNHEYAMGVRAYGNKE